MGSDAEGIKTLRFGGAVSVSESEATKECALSSSDQRPSAARSSPREGSMSISIVCFEGMELVMDQREVSDQREISKSVGLSPGFVVFEGDWPVRFGRRDGVNLAE